MNRVKMFRLFSLLLIFLLSGYFTAFAQAPKADKLKEQKAVSIKPESARKIAWQRYGTVPDLSKGGEVIGGALVIKIRAGYGGTIPAIVATNVAQLAGLRVSAATPLAGLQTPLALSVQEKRSSLSSQKQAKILQAEDELARIIEVCYEGPLHPRRAAALFQGMPEVEYAEPMSVPQILSPESPNDPRLDTQVQLSFVNALEAWEVTPGDSTVVIGVIDAGINMFHEDLWPNIAENPGEAGVDGEGKDKATNGVDDDNNGVIDDWKGANLSFYLDGTDPGNTVGSEHGTQVSGYSSAATDNGIGIAGISNQCRFFPVKTASRDGGGLVEAYNGVLYCARRGFQVINCSWGDSDFSQMEEDLIRNVTLAYDVAVVCAAGNDLKYGIQYPAAYRFALGVGGVDAQNRYLATWGEHVDITSTSGTTTSGTSNYFNLSPATSYTAPVVSGIVALVRSRWPELSALQALTHVRLTARNIDALNLEKSKLIGYGRADAFDAVSVDPFSHPGLLIDSVWVTDEQGNPKEFFGLGEKGVLWYRVVNVLGDLVNGTAQVSRYSEDSTSIRFSGAPIEIGELKSGESWVTPQGVPFEAIGPGKGLTKIRIDFTGDEYNDYAYERMRLYRPYSIYSTSRANITLTESGHLGFAYRDFGEVGEGLTFDTRSFLYEGGLIVAENTSKVLDNIRAEDPSNFVQNDDFTTLEVPNEANDFTLTLADAGVPPGARIGLELRMQVQTIDTVANAIGLQVRARNVRETAIDSLHLGLFLDWDIDGFTDGQTVRYVAGPEGNIQFYGVAANPAGSRVAAGVARTDANPAFFAIRYNTDPLSLSDGFSKGEKWRTVSNGIGNPEAGPGDISMVIASVFGDIPPGGEDTALFVLGFSSADDAEAIDGMRRFVGRQVSSVASGNVIKPEDIRIRPNPVMGQMEIIMPEQMITGQNATMFLRTVDGREVMNLSGMFTGNLITGGEFRIDLSNIPSGLYYLQFENGAQSLLRPVFVVK